MTVGEVYAAHARRGLEPVKVASEYGIPLADFHKALAYYYRHAERMRGMVDDGGFGTPLMDEYLE